MIYKVLIADDHAIIRDGLRKILADTQDMQVGDEATTGNGVLERVRAEAWDLLVLDLSMPGRNGLELIKLVKSECPKLPILIFSMHPEEQYAVRCIRAGATGYLSKESDSELLLPAMRKVAGGGVYISPKVAELMALDFSQPRHAPSHALLSDREFEVFNRIVRGDKLTDIAEALCLSIKTVSTHKSHILAKLQLDNNADLYRYALEHKLLDIQPL